MADADQLTDSLRSEWLSRGERGKFGQLGLEAAEVGADGADQVADRLRFQGNPELTGPPDDPLLGPGGRERLQRNRGRPPSQILVLGVLARTLDQNDYGLRARVLQVSQELGPTLGL